MGTHCTFQLTVACNGVHPWMLFVLKSYTIQIDLDEKRHTHSSLSIFHTVSFSLFFSRASNSTHTLYVYILDGRLNARMCMNIIFSYRFVSQCIRISRVSATLFFLFGFFFYFQNDDISILNAQKFFLWHPKRRKFRFEMISHKSHHKNRLQLPFAIFAIKIKSIRHIKQYIVIVVSRLSCCLWHRPMQLILNLCLIFDSSFFLFIHSSQNTSFTWSVNWNRGEKSVQPIKSNQHDDDAAVAAALLLDHIYFKCKITHSTTFCANSIDHGDNDEEQGGEREQEREKCNNSDRFQCYASI